MTDYIWLKVQTDLVPVEYTWNWAASSDTSAIAANSHANYSIDFTYPGSTTPIHITSLVISGGVNFEPDMLTSGPVDLPLARPVALDVISESIFFNTAGIVTNESGTGHDYFLEGKVVDFSSMAPSQVDGPVVSFTPAIHQHFFYSDGTLSGFSGNANPTIFYNSYVWVKVALPSTSLFTTGSDNVDFNSQDPQELQLIKNAIQNGTAYNGLGGSDAVTLPNTSTMTKIGWGYNPNGNFTGFYTNSTPADAYKVTGGDGVYTLHLGAGKDIVDMSKALSSTIFGGSGDGVLTFAGLGTNTVHVEAGTQTISLSGTGDCTLIFDQQNEHVVISNIAGYTGTIHVSGFVATDTITFNQPGLTTCATYDAEHDSGYANIGVPGELDVYSQSQKIATLVFSGGKPVTDLEPMNNGGSTAIMVDPLAVAKENYQGGEGLGHVHWDIIRQNEGNELEPYALTGRNAGLSGVTVGTGVDLGNLMTRTDFAELFPNYVADGNLKLLWDASGTGSDAGKPRGPTKQAAVDFLNTHGTTYQDSGAVQSISSSITESQANTLGNYAEQAHFDETVQQWKNASTGVNFYSLPWQVQTVLVDLHYNTGSIRSGNLIRDVATAYNLSLSPFTKPLANLEWGFVEADLVRTNLAAPRLIEDFSLINQLLTPTVQNNVQADPTSLLGFIPALFGFHP